MLSRFSKIAPATQSLPSSDNYSVVNISLPYKVPADSWIVVVGANWTDPIVAGALQQLSVYDPLNPNNYVDAIIFDKTATSAFTAHKMLAFPGSTIQGNGGVGTAEVVLCNSLDSALAIL